MNVFTYYNPVNIRFGTGTLAEINRWVGNRRVLLVTTAGFIKRGILDRLGSVAGQIVGVLDQIPPNPTFVALRDLYATAWEKEFDVIVALGGGSIMDGAKALSVYDDSHQFDIVEGIIRGTRAKSGYKLKPMIAIPTTAGTGSELTPWATVWDMEEKKKYSLHLPNLWAEACICDPELTLSLPRDITVQTSLDALSQALEAIWNKNANPISTRYAITAAREIMTTLPLLADDLSNLELRTRQMWGSLNTALAFSNTQTAVAHAISYYVTAQKGTPHGIACSFTLPDIIDTMTGVHSEVDFALNAIFGAQGGDAARNLLKILQVSTHPADYGLSEKDLSLIRQSLTGNIRAGNSLVPVEPLFDRLERYFAA